MVAWAATVKFGKRSTAKIAVKPMAGTARIVPAINPLRRSWSASANFQELELPLLGLLVSELAVEDVADLGEVARPAGALVVDGLALRDELEALDGALDLDARALRDLAHVVPDRRAGGLALGLRQGEHDEARLVVGLARIRIDVVGAEHLGQTLVRVRVRRGRRRPRVRPVRDLGRQRAEQLLVHRERRRDLAGVVTGLV